MAKFICNHIFKIKSVIIFSFGFVLLLSYIFLDYYSCWHKHVALSSEWKLKHQDADFISNNKLEEVEFPVPAQQVFLDFKPNFTDGCFIRLTPRNHYAPKIKVMRKNGFFRLVTYSNYPIQIPLRFHQQFKSELVPKQNFKSIRSLKRHHNIQNRKLAKKDVLKANFKSFKDVQDSFQYVFWTDERIQGFLRNNSYSELFLYSKYQKKIEKSDVARYYILYEFGGIYADLDIRFLNSMLPVLNSGIPCLLPAEPFHQSVTWLGICPAVTNCLMFCRPKHPFLRMLIESLPEFFGLSNTMCRTGPGFMTQILDRYRNLDKERTEQCDETTSSRSDCVLVVESAVFHPYSLTRKFEIDKNIEFCREVIEKDYKFWMEYSYIFDSCVEWKLNGYSITPDLFSLTVHDSNHIGWDPDKYPNELFHLSSIFQDYLYYDLNSKSLKVHS